MRLWDFFFYAAFALVVVSFVRIAGVLLTFAYLIVPAVCAVMLAKKTWLSRLLVGWGMAATASLAGLWSSYRFDLPTGAAIVVACGVLLVVVSPLPSWQRKLPAGPRSTAMPPPPPARFPFPFVAWAPPRSRC